MESLSLACRVCLHCCNDSNSLFDEVEYDQYIKLSNVFRKVTKIEISETDAERPTHLCQECTERLLNAYEFICAVEKAEAGIENYLSNKILEEEDRQQQEQGQEQDEDAVEIETTTDADVQEIEILDEEFLTENDLVDNSTANEEVVLDDIIAESQTELCDGDGDGYEAVIAETESTVDPIEREFNTDQVGSRLSKRRSSNYVKCNSCQRSFAKMETLDRHIKLAHTVMPRSAQAAQNISADDKRITCPYCPQFFKRRNNYIRHLMTCHSKEAEHHLTPEDKELAKTKQTYKRGICPHCGQSFTQASLIIHIRRHTGENPYQCNQCEKAYPRRQDLNIHQRQHSGEKPHSCSVCGKSFSRANKLARHMRIHTGERPYKCTKCERSFTQSNDLKIHMRRHTGEKPYRCSVCSDSFICGAALKTHRKQKNHHSPADEQDDPFANWRVSKRKLKTDVNLTVRSDKEFYSKPIDEVGEAVFKMEIEEVILD